MQEQRGNNGQVSDVSFSFMDAHPSRLYPRGRDDFDLKMEGENGNISYSLVFLIETRFLIGEEDCRELGTCVCVSITIQCIVTMELLLYGIDRE